jgi:murein L,D-transpeptidase YafK
MQRYLFKKYLNIVCYKMFFNLFALQKNNFKVKRIMGFRSLILIGCLMCFSFWPILTSASLNQADKVVVIKSKRIMMLMRDSEIMKVYRVALGKQPNGSKIKSGDQKTPEGTYILDSRKTDSKFYKAIHISYPNESDILKAERLGCSPGGAIMIHGLPTKLQEIGKAHRLWDWTDGCIAVTNSEIEEIWELVPDGTPIEIKP